MFAKMRTLLVVVVLIGARVAQAEPCRPDAKPAAVLAKARSEAHVFQSCEGGYVAFDWTKDDNKTAQVARCDATACKVIASWQGLQNCDAGLCDHFSTVDGLSIALVADIDGDARPDAVLDFASIHGDQGREDHRLSLWLSRAGALRKSAAFEGRIDAVSAVRGGFAVKLHDGVDADARPDVRCFSRSGPMACPAAAR